MWIVAASSVVGACAGTADPTPDAAGESSGNASPAPDTTAGPTTATTVRTSPSTTDVVPASAPDTTASQTHPSTVPTTSDATHGSAAPPIDPITSFEPVDRILDLPAACEPVWSERQADEITFARGNELFAYRPSTGAVSCLAVLDRSPTRLDWSPDGTTLLVDADVLVDATGARPSGFDPGTAGISWSRPNGEALIAPSSDGTRLVHIDRDDASAVTDVAALAETWAAAYHPSGEAILAAGVAPDGRRGLFIADNDGGQLEQALTLDDPTDTITELSVSADGTSVNFIHDHAGTSDGVAAHVHRLDLASIFVIDVATYGDVVPTGMVTSTGSDNTLAFELGRSTVNHTTVLADGADLRTFRVAEQRIVPVGLIDGDTVVGVLRSDGTPVGTPGSLVTTDGIGAPRVLAEDVMAAATRVAPHPTWADPPLGIPLQAVG